MESQRIQAGALNGDDTVLRAFNRVICSVAFVDDQRVLAFATIDRIESEWCINFVVATAR